MYDCKDWTEEVLVPHDASNTFFKTGHKPFKSKYLLKQCGIKSHLWKSFEHWNSLSAWTKGKNLCQSTLSELILGHNRSSKS